MGRHSLIFRARALAAALIWTIVSPFMGSVSAGNLVVQEIRPSDADPPITRFNEPNYVVIDDEATAAAQLVVFMPGTGGKPANASQLLGVVAHLGYRVIGLEYNDEPAVVEVCPKSPIASCSGNFRRRRIFGGDVNSVVANTESETIVTRLVKLLQYLDVHDAAGHWGDYLEGGEPNWPRIVVSGLSQGAGMAAYIAKQKPVARVVLFSSPWDFQRDSRRLAPWLIEPGATPPERWYAEYHRREKTAALIAQAYQALQIPPSHIRVFDLDLPSGFKVKGDNPYHSSTIKVAAYAPDWEFLFGRSP
jgi:predicted esterase